MSSLFRCMSRITRDLLRCEIFPKYQFESDSFVFRLFSSHTRQDLVFAIRDTVTLSPFLASPTWKMSMNWIFGCTSASLYTKEVFRSHFKLTTVLENANFPLVCFLSTHTHTHTPRRGIEPSGFSLCFTFALFLSLLQIHRIYAIRRKTTNRQMVEHSLRGGRQIDCGILNVWCSVAAKPSISSRNDCYDFRFDKFMMTAHQV